MMLVQGKTNLPIEIEIEIESGFSEKVNSRGNVCVCVCVCNWKATFTFWDNTFATPKGDLR